MGSGWKCYVGVAPNARCSTFISKVGWYVLWGGIKVEKVEKVGFAVHRASFVFFEKRGR